MALGQKGTGFHNWLNARTQRVGMLDYCGHHLHAGAVCHVSVMVPCLLFDPGSGRDVDCVSPVWRTVHLNSCTILSSFTSYSNIVSFIIVSSVRTYLIEEGTKARCFYGVAGGQRFGIKSVWLSRVRSQLHPERGGQKRRISVPGCHTVSVRVRDLCGG